MDTQQLTAQFLANRHGLFSFIFGLVRNMQDAEDILQEVWIRFSDALDRGVEIEDQARWCRGVARNLILHYWRDKKNAKVIADDELFELVESALVENEPTSEIWQARRKALGECIQILPEKSRRLLHLRYDEANPTEKISQLLGQSAASIMMALSRIRRTLQQCVEAKLKSPGFGT